MYHVFRLQEQLFLCLQQVLEIEKIHPETIEKTFQHQQCLSCLLGEVNKLLYLRLKVHRLNPMSFSSRCC